MTSKQQPCLQFKQGKCSNGDDCLFSHDEYNTTQRSSLATASIITPSILAPANISAATKPTSFLNVFKSFAINSKSKQFSSSTTAAASSPGTNSITITTSTRNSDPAGVGNKGVREGSEWIENNFESATIDSKSNNKTKLKEDEGEKRKVRECDIGCGEDGSVICTKGLHAFCKDCFQYMIKTQFRNKNNTLRFTCQMEGCNGSLFEFQNVLSNLSGTFLVDVVKFIKDQDIINGNEIENERENNFEEKKTAGITMCPAGHKLCNFLTGTASFSCDNCNQTLKLGAQLYGCRICNYDICFPCSQNQTTNSKFLAKPVSLTNASLLSKSRLPTPLNFFQTSFLKQKTNAESQAPSVATEPASIDPPLSSLSIAALNTSSISKLNTSLNTSSILSPVSPVNRQNLISISQLQQILENTQASLPKTNLPCCRNDHTLKELKTAHDEYECSICESKFPQDYQMFSCKICNYDVCTKCFEFLKQSSIEQTISPFEQQTQFEVPHKILCCPVQHELLPFITTNAYICDQCFQQIPSDTQMYGCRQCRPTTFDLCQNCYDDQQTQPTQTFRNRDGAIVKRGDSGRYYCGRKGLYNCEGCGDNCGPNDGCTCPACEEFNTSRRITLYQHPVGTPFTRKKTLHCPLRHRLVPFVAPNTYICDQCFERVLPGTQMYGCKECHPTTFDLCQNCYDDQQTQPTQTFRNRDGAAVTLGDSGRYYCGRKGLHDCGSCDSHCGPNDGCACPACEEFNEKRNIENFKHSAHMISGTTIRNQYLRNRDGAIVVRGEDGRFYCGRSGLYKCNKCSGRCGPFTGCACPACCDLTMEHRIFLHRHQQWMQFHG